MRRSAPKIADAFLFSLLLIALPILKVFASGPDFPYAIIFSTAHPDFPLRYFASGNLGVIQPGWAKSYLCVVYRYLTNNSLDNAEQASILKLWNKRLKMQELLDETAFDEVNAYLQLRAKALGTDDKKLPSLYFAVDRYSYEQRIYPDAFRLARLTLADRIKRYGLGSRQVREWISGQDIVFGINPSKKTIPPVLPNSFDKLLCADRNYQIAAATLYSKSYARAAQLFEEIAKDKQSPWQRLASYLVARCKANLVLSGANEQEREAVIAYLKGLIQQTVDPNCKDDLVDLLVPVTYMQMSLPQIIDHLVSAISHPHCRRFGGNVGDLTFVLDDARANNGNMRNIENKKDTAIDPGKIDQPQKQEAAEDTTQLNKHDLTAWLKTIQQSDNVYSYYSFIEQKQRAALATSNANFALQKWRYTKSLPWLVAAMCCNTLRSLELKDVYEAARIVPPSSPAYLTAGFFVIDALIYTNKSQEARKLLKLILLRKDLQPTARNLFQAQLLKVTTCRDEYFCSAIVLPPESSYGTLILPKDWKKRQTERSYATEDATLDYPVARDWNCNLPLSLWMKLSKDKNVPYKLRGRIVRCAWLRAQLLNKPQQAAALQAELVAAYPMLMPLMQKYNNAPEGDAKRFALAYLILKTCGMTPYLQSGIERHGLAINEFDFYNANFWLPLPVTELPEDASEHNYEQAVMAPGSNPILKMVQDYYKPGLKRLLKKQEISSANLERTAIAQINPAKFLGNPVLSWAKSYPKDPLIPEALYRIVRLPKWTARTDIGSQYSRQAYIVLHSQYPRSPWTAKAVCWY